MSPSERTILPVGARGKPVLGVFQAAVGAFWASTAAPASTGSSRLGGAAQRTFSVDGAGIATPRMVRARPSGPMRGARQPRPDDGRRGLHRRGDLGPLQQVAPIPEFDRPVTRFP